jgi:hypothetical protein
LRTLKFAAMSEKNEPIKKNDKSGVPDESDQLLRLNQKAYLNSKGIKPGSAVQLDMFEIVSKGKNLRHIPNDYARSSLFSACNHNEKRKTMLRQKLFHYNEFISILYTGVELRAEDDELVWLQILSYGKSITLGEPFDFFIKDIVHDIGWTKSGRNYERVRECISRLKANEVLAKNTKEYGKSASLSLIHKYTSVNDAKGKPTKYRVWIDPNLILLFAGNTFSSLQWESYRKLSPVARRLTDWIVSHTFPFPLDLEKFRQMCGSEGSCTRDWRRIVKKACADIEKAGIAHKVYVAANKICCERNETADFKKLTKPRYERDV